MNCPKLLTPGRIADALGVPLHRVQHVLATRSRIQPSARAGRLRLFDKAAVKEIERELAAIDGRHGKGVAHE